MSVNGVLGLGIELPQESCLGTKKVVGSVLKKSPMSTYYYYYSSHNLLNEDVKREKG